MLKIERVTSPNGDIIEVNRTASKEFTNDLWITTESRNVTKDVPQRWSELQLHKQGNFVRVDVSDTEGGGSIILDIDQIKALRDELNDMLRE